MHISHRSLLAFLLLTSMSSMHAMEPHAKKARTSSIRTSETTELLNKKFALAITLLATLEKKRIYRYNPTQELTSLLQTGENPITCILCGFSYPANQIISHIQNELKAEKKAVAPPTPQEFIAAPAKTVAPKDIFTYIE